MQPRQYTLAAVFFLVLCQLAAPSFGQLGVTLDIKKPKEYEDRTLRSERSEEKKFNLPRRFIQNNVTRYNYVFNAKNKLNDVLDRAKTAFKDDYSKLLPFYNYTLEATAADSTQLDSITYKSSTGIALHDLRNDWADNLYLLWGAAYYLQKKFDSAYLMFQFINYAFAPKEKDGYYLAIGSSLDGNKAYSISTKEKKSIPRKIFAEPPSRNDAFIWQIRNFLAQDQFAEAASLIVTLRNDPVFPKRLQNDLHEVQAFWFYKQNMWDSAVMHLVLALDNATSKQEKARWEYLAGQLYEMTGQDKEAEKYYAKVITHTTDPIMDIYARLYRVRVNKDGGDNYAQKNIEQLVKMAKRDKYVDYRDIIYYMAAQMEMDRNNTDGAIALLEKGSKYPSGDATQRNRLFLQLAELSFKKRLYRQAYNYYDSLTLDDPMLGDPKELTARKDILGKIASSMEIIERQDSLQRIANMPEDQRRDFIKQLVKQLRRQQGLKDEGVSTSSGSSIFPQTPTNAPLFPIESKGEWYFYNTSYRTKGLVDFKTKWGNRTNIDNWRRSSGSINNTQNNNPMNNVQTGLVKIDDPGNTDNDITYDNLLKKLPLAPDQVNLSNDSIQTALLALGKAYIQEIEDCQIGTETLEKLRTRFPQFDKMDDVLFNLYYCYNKNGETAKAAAIKKLMTEKYPGSNFTAIITTGKNPQSNNSEATKAYENVYDLFIEGNFTEAVAQKKNADSLYGRNFWTPRLRYIEAIYYIKQREDTTAKTILRDIVAQYSSTPMAIKAGSLLDVLNRRQQIETELRNLSITRYDTSSKAPVTVVNNNPPVRKDTATTKPPLANNTNTPKKDSVATKPPPVKLNSPFIFAPADAHYVVIVLNKVDQVFATESRNAFLRYNRDTYYNKSYNIEIVQLDGENRLLLMSPFNTSQEAIDYIDKARPKAAAEIIPWLKAEKYSFSIINEKNLTLLKDNKDLGNYKQFLSQSLPGKF